MDGVKRKTVDSFFNRHWHLEMRHMMINGMTRLCKTHKNGVYQLLLKSNTQVCQGIVMVHALASLRSFLVDTSAKHRFGTEIVVA